MEGNTWRDGSAARCFASSATFIGAGAILLWATLGLLTVMASPLPPLQLTAMGFAVSAIVGLAVIAVRGRWGSLRAPAPAWLLGVGGLFGYHAAYFAALTWAPPAEAGLINYLWPLLIVLLAALLPGERLRARHVVGAVLGFAGVAVLGTGSLRGLSAGGTVPAGLALALVSAVIWSAYSVASLRFAAVPSDAVAGFCAATAVLAGLAHGAFEATVWPLTPRQIVAVGLLGCFPLGAAFYLWDHGVKHGDIRLLGVLAYATPVLSTLALIGAGYAAPSWGLAAACGLIVGGAAVASAARP